MKVHRNDKKILEAEAQMSGIDLAGEEICNPKGRRKLRSNLLLNTNPSNEDRSKLY